MQDKKPGLGLPLLYSLFNFLSTRGRAGEEDCFPAAQGSLGSPRFQDSSWGTQGLALNGD